MVQPTQTKIADQNESLLQPSYYTENGAYEPIKIIEELDLNFNEGNVLKYLLRHGKSADNQERIKDLKKIMTYAQFEINRLGKLDATSNAQVSSSTQSGTKAGK